MPLQNLGFIAEPDRRVVRDARLDRQNAPFVVGVAEIPYISLSDRRLHERAKEPHAETLRAHTLGR